MYMIKRSEITLSFCVFSFDTCEFLNVLKMLILYVSVSLQHVHKHTINLCYTKINAPKNNRCLQVFINKQKFVLEETLYNIGVLEL